MEKIGFRIPLILSIALYLTALFLPVYSGKALAGYWALLGGWITGLNSPLSAVTWLANIPFFLAIVMILKRKNPRPFAALVLSVVALILGLAVLGAESLAIGVSQTMENASMGMAYYGWLGSIVLLVIASWIKFKKR